VTALSDGEATVDAAPAREHQQAGTTDLQALFAPRGVLVVGASADPDKLGGAMARALSAAPVPVALVNSRGGPGMHTTAAEAADHVRRGGGSPDLAVVCVPAPACADVVEACAEQGVSAVLVCAGGFSEAGGDGVEHERTLRQAVARTGVRLLGPNTSGFFVPAAGLRASFVPGAAHLRPGGVAVVAASGGLNHALAFGLARHGSGLSLGVGIGSGLDVTAVDVLEHLAADPGTRAVALHLETVPDGPALLAAVRRTTRRLPVVVLVVGRHDVSGFAASHTGALATSWRTTRALLRQAGAVVVDREDDLVTAAAVLAQTRSAARPRPGAALVTAQAGPGLVVADVLHEAGVHVPELGSTTRATLGDLLPPLTYQLNPVDTGRPGPRHGEVVAAVAGDPAVDVVAVYALTEPVVDLPAAVAAARAACPVVLGLDGPSDEVVPALEAARSAGVPAVVGAQALARATAAVAEDAALRWATTRGAETSRASGAPGSPAGDGPAPVPTVAHGAWDEAAAKEVLDALGVTTPPRQLCHDRSAAHAALDALATGGRAVVVKVSDATIVHKSDVGGVHVGIRDHEALDVALDALAPLGRQPCLVEQMAPGGTDLVVGARRDPVFGPVVLVGLGGTATEVLADVAIAAVPATRAWLEGLPEELRSAALLHGHRGAVPVDTAALAVVLERLGDLLLANPDLAEIEINPLRATAAGLVALDAVVLTQPHASPPDEPRTRTGTRRNDT